MFNPGPPGLDQLKAYLITAFDDSPSRESRFKAMFGGACACCNGRVFASLSNVGLALKIDSATAQMWLNRGGKWLQYERMRRFPNRMSFFPMRF